MSPRRKAGAIGIFIGSALLTSGVLAFIVPVLLAVRALVRHQELSSEVVWWVTGVPPGIILVAFGALVFFLSMLVYLDAKRKENPLI
jgi:amino acid permease